MNVRDNKLTEMVFHRPSAARPLALPLIDMRRSGGSAVIVYGGHRVVDGAITPGRSSRDHRADGLSPLRALSKLSAHLQEGLAAAERVSPFSTPATMPIRAPPTPYRRALGPSPLKTSPSAMTGRTPPSAM